MSTVVGVGKRAAHKKWFVVLPNKWHTLLELRTLIEDYWLCAGGLLAVNAIGTQSRYYPTNSTSPILVDGLDRHRREKKWEEG